MTKINYTAEDLESYDGIGAVLKDSKGRILMQEHVKYGFWTIPVGKGKKGQNPEDALKEELSEECGIKIKSFKEIAIQKQKFKRNGKKVEVLMHIYEIEKYSGKIQNKEPHKHSAQEFKSLEEIKKLPYLSDSTLLYLKAIGTKRKAKL